MMHECYLWVPKTKLGLSAIGYVQQLRSILLQAMTEDLVLPLPPEKPPTMTSQMECEDPKLVMARTRSRFSYDV